MTLEDPFFVVKDEVIGALDKTQALFVRWVELHNVAATTPTTEQPPPLTREELDWIKTELKNSLKSIDWDLEDLEETISIVEKNRSKFKIDSKELVNRRKFIEHTREEVKKMKDKMNYTKERDFDNTARQPLLDNSPPRFPSAHDTTRYSQLSNQFDSPNRKFLQSTLQQQSTMMQQQDEQIDMLGDTVNNLKTVSRHINSELEEQQVMLDDFGNELEVTESKLDATMKKVAKVLHMSNGNYTDYVPAPTTSKTNNNLTNNNNNNNNKSNYFLAPCPFTFLSATLANCFLCAKH